MSSIDGNGRPRLDERMSELEQQAVPPPRRTVADRSAFCNYDWLDTDDGRRKQPRCLPDLATTLLETTRGWPKRLGSNLFVQDQQSSPVFLGSTDQAFAYIQSVCPVRWSQAEGYVRRTELYEHLRTTVEVFSDVATVPHFPAVPSIYYAHATIPTVNRGYVDELCSRFTPLTETDRNLIRAAFMTPFWGGREGKRPMFVVCGPEDDSSMGRGVGKSLLAQVLAYLAGGLIELSPTDDIARIKVRLLSEGAQSLRVCRLDNVKSHRFSWADLEALVTSPVISGHRLYCGEARRPNLLTWLITMNGASLSKDLAQRAVVIKLARPTDDPTWDDRLWEFVEENRWNIIAEIGQILQGANHDD